MRLAAHDGWPATRRRAMPVRRGVTVKRTLPLAALRPAALMPAPLNSTRAFRTNRPRFRTVTVTTVRRPTDSVRGVDVSE